MHTLKIENTRNLTSSSLLYNYIDNISLIPVMPNLAVSDMNIPCSTGKQVTFTIKAGLSNSGKPYMMWMSATGNFPGVMVQGQHIPLNMDALFLFGLSNPNFAGSTGFIGNLDFFGMASPTLTLPPDIHKNFEGIPIYFAYVITAPGPKLPISFVSTPVHINYLDI